MKKKKRKPKKEKKQDCKIKVPQLEKKIPLEMAIKNFIYEIKRPFKIKDVVEYVKPQVEEEKRLNKIVKKELEDNKKILFDNKKKHFVPAGVIFENAKFLIQPEPIEIKNGILIQGHRFLPFLKEEDILAELEVNLSNGDKLEYKNIDFLTLKDINPYYAFISKEDFFLYLTENPANIEILKNKNFNGKVNIKVFDFKNFYKENHFKKGDYLLVTVKNWLEGKYILEYMAKSDIKKKDIKSWCESFKIVMEEVCRTFGSDLDIYHQFLQAFFQDISLLETPKASLYNFIKGNKLLVLTENANQFPVIWLKGESVNIYSELEDFEGPIGRMGTIEGIFKDIGLFSSEKRMNSYIKNELYKGNKKNIKKLMEKIVPGFIQFYDKEQKKRLEHLLDELWENLEKSYAASNDKIAGKYREELFTICEKFDELRVYMPLLITEPSEKERIQVFHSMLGLISSILDALNKEDESFKTGVVTEEKMDEVIEKSNKMYEYFKEKTADIEVNPVIQNLIESFYGELESPIESGKKLKSKKKSNLYKANQSKIFEFKIKLLGTSVWRKIQVPGNIKLTKFHDIIQTAMGWEDCHLYEFDIDDVLYSGNPDDGFNPAESLFGAMFGKTDSKPAEKIKIYQVFKIGSKCIYTYDFGDSWEHQITVEKIFDAEPKKKYPVCVAGKNNCPPEDCGGYPGYQNLLEVLADKKNPEHEEMLEWAGEDFDPKEFNISDINEELRYF